MKESYLVSFINYINLVNITNSTLYLQVGKLAKI